MIVARIQSRDIVQRVAAGIFKKTGVLHRDFLEGFQAIRRESGAGDIQAFDALLAERRDRFVRIRAQPFFATDARLE